MAADQLEQLWIDVQESLARLVPEGAYKIWLQHLRPVALDDRVLYLEAPEQILDWVGRRFMPTLTAALRAADPVLRTVELLNRAAVAPAANAERVTRPASSALDDAASCSARHLNPVNTFTQFVIGDENRFAHAAALAVAELPGHAYNPLLLHGSPGTGKTHLLQAVANYVAVHEPRLKIAYLTAETFTSNFRSALRSSEIEAFKRHHRNLDVLLMDDVHFFKQKKHSSEEFLFTVDELIQAGSQVVLSSELPPAAMTFLTERLRQRLQGALVVELQPPGFNTRFAVLRKRAPQLAANPNHLDVLSHLARSITANVRVLEGALIRVHAYASLTRRPITTELADRVLSTLESVPSFSNQSPQALSVHLIQRHTSTTLKVDQSTLQSSQRSRQVVYARQVAMYLCREFTTLSLPEIARHFGGRNHTTVMHAHRKISQLLLTDPHTRDLIAHLSDKLSATSSTQPTALPHRSLTDQSL